MVTKAPQMVREPNPAQASSESESLLSSQVFAWLCHWCALTLVIAAGACLIGWKLEHPSMGAGIFMMPSYDPFGIATPPWIVELGAPVYVAAVIGQAFWNALHGRRSWRNVVAAGMMIAVLAAGKALQAFIK